MTTNHYKYAGYEYDAESGFDHAEFREYAGNLGRFAVPDPYSGSMDPSNPQSFNRYGYVLNNPMNSTDPSGLFPGAEGAAPLCGPAAPLCLAGAVIGDIFQLLHLFGHHHANLPVFHGSTNPRPPLQGETNGLPDGIRLPHPSIWQTIGLTPDGCEFGPCAGGGLGFEGNGTHICGDFNCDQNNRQIGLAPASIRGLSEDVNAEFFMIGAATRGGSAALDALGARGPIFGTRMGGNVPLLNGNDTLRIGWSYIRSSGKYVFRVGGTTVAAVKSNPHINLWPPSWWFK